MNQDLLNQLNSSNLSNDDIQNLLKALGQTSLGNKGKGLKMSAQDKNNLLSMISLLFENHFIDISFYPILKKEFFFSYK